MYVLVGVIFIGVIVGSVIVGLVVEPESTVAVNSGKATVEPTADRFNWELAALVLTGLGTTLLALATAVLSTATWQDVRAAQSMAIQMEKANDLTRREQNERMRPAVIGAAGFGGGNHTLNVELHNIGGGPAIRVEVGAVYLGGTTIDVAGLNLAVLTAGGSMPIELSFEGERPPGGIDHGAFRVTGQFFDRLGRPAGRIIDWKQEPILSSV